LRRKVIRVREITGKRIINKREYHYKYYTLSLNIYIPKRMVEKYGRNYIMEFNRDTGELVIRPSRGTELENIKELCTD